ncbi:unnamed protein product, partial [Symbiodinium necroappetens]
MASVYTAHSVQVCPQEAAVRHGSADVCILLIWLGQHRLFSVRKSSHICAFGKTRRSLDESLAWLRRCGIAAANASAIISFCQDLVGISAPVGIAELAEVLCRSNELDLEVLFENISSWNAAAHFQDDHEMGDVPNRLVGLIAEASHRSQWDRASVAVYALTGATCLHMQGMTAALKEDALLMTKLQHSVLLAVAAFGEMLDDALLAGSQGSSPSAADFTEKQSLAELVRSLASFLLELLPSLPLALADMLLAIPGLPGALLCAASTSPATLGKSSSLLSSSVSFVVLRAQRALADLLTSVLEETSTEVRASQELLLGSVEPGASRLVETLILSRPDPKLHQLLLELLWRALRRVP